MVSLNCVGYDSMGVVRTMSRSYLNADLVRGLPFEAVRMVAVDGRVVGFIAVRKALDGSGMYGIGLMVPYVEDDIGVGGFPELLSTELERLASMASRDAGKRPASGDWKAVSSLWDGAAFSPASGWELLSVVNRDCGDYRLEERMGVNGARVWHLYCGLGRSFNG